MLKKVLSTFYLLFLRGTSSTISFLENGLHEINLFNVSQKAKGNLCILKHSIAYAEHVGKYLHVFGSKGLIQNL